MAHGEVDEGFHSRKLGLAPPNINVTPLIDVLLVLLIIFMVIQPQKEAKFQSQIPQPAPENMPEKKTPSKLLVVDIMPGGQGPDQVIQLNRQQMSLADLGTRLSDLLSDPLREDKTVLIKSPKAKPYGDVVAVIDVVKAAGAEPIGLQVDDLAD
jgi:biopolymer transport protein ExbD